MASGRPVIAYPAGGVTETVIPGRTGVFFPEQSWESLVDTLMAFDPLAWERERIRAHALKFKTATFKEKIARYVNEKYTRFEEERREQRVLAHEGI